MAETTKTRLDEILEKLNKEQRECVENLEGKFLVLAGPGTGKTYTVIKRLQAMILQGVAPERILCMTYSRAGADEMKKRVLEELDENNNNVEIYTFHSFCNKIIGEYPEEFDVPESVQLIPESIERALMKECIDEKTDAVYYKSDRANKYACYKSLKPDIKYLKHYRITTDEILEKYLDTDPDWRPALRKYETERDTATKVSERCIKKIEEYTKKIEKVKELFEFYKLYREKMELSGYIDYDDMINYILEKFEADSSFAQKISNQYDYIIIDEYQDTNKSQNELIFHLVDNSDKGNIFVVGDDKQIVNASQGARIDSVKEFWEKYKDEIKAPIKLVENRRSTQIILNVAETVAQQNTKLIDRDIHLKAVNEEVTKKEEKVRLTIYHDEEEQALDIVSQIDELVNSPDCLLDKDTKEKDYSQIAILSTSNDDIAYFADLLHNRNIPYEVKEGKSIFDIKASVILYSYLQALVDPESYSDAILRLLLLPPFNVSPQSFRILKEENSRHPSMIDAMNEIVKSKDAPDDIKKFIDTYNELKNTYLKGETVYKVVSQCASKTGILDFFFNFETNRLENTLALKRLLDEAYEYSKQHKKVNLEDFVDYLNMLQQDGIPIKIDKELIKSNAIQLSTYQSAKGLEFEYVFMPSLKPRKWESSTRPIIQPKSVPLPQYEAKSDEEWKVYKRTDKINKMYVGMTRAKRFLRLSYIGTNGAGGHSTLLKIGEIPEEYLVINDLCKDEPVSIAKKPAEVPVIKDFDYVKEFKKEIDERIAKIKHYSPTFITPYIKCPRMFFFNEVLELGSPNFDIPDSLNFGKAVHKACENVFTLKNRTWDSESFVEEIINEIDKYPFSSHNQREHFKTLARENIKEFYDNELALARNTIYTIESDIITDFEGVSFKGLPDRVNLVDGKFKIYDYKTGVPKTNKEICFTSPDDEKIGGHEDYYIQMGLYKYFLEKTDEEGRKVVETTFLFPQDWRKPCRIEYSDEDIEKILDKLRYAIKGIQARKFDPTPSKHSCMYCPYKNTLCELGK